ncbi:MAG: DNA helicase RecQ [Legionellales bacterium]|nr:DNA helicase RecQ [Legionellales bacterium]
MSEKNGLDILQRIFGYDSFRPLQQDIINTVCDNQDCLVLMPTGGGKSLCFQIPALIKSGTAIVVSPLISLMQDQVQALQQNGVAAAYYNSSLDSKTSRQVLAQFHQQELDLLYIAPERLMMPAFLERLKEIEISLFAIDEAHCVSQWGHEFRPEYTQLKALPQLFPQIPIIALTATADKQTRQDIILQLRLRDPKKFIASFNRPNISYTVIEKYKPLNQVLDFLQTHRHQAGIIYCTTRSRVEELNSSLQARDFKCLPYHAGLSHSLREKALQSFQLDEIDIVVATLAFGMGIDKSNVRFIIHYDMPKHLEAYYQETGRSGRDGMPAEAVLLYGPADIARNRGLIDNMQNEQQKRIEIHKLNAMAAFAETQHCRRRVLLNYFSENLQENCQNCDICLNPPQYYDALTDAQKVLSCVYRVNQRFGINHIVSVLLGHANAQITKFKHDTLSTFAIGKDKSAEHWFSVIRQLIHLGFLEQDIANYSVLRLTEQARPLLRGEIALSLATPRVKLNKPSTVKKPTINKDDLDYEEDLFQRLRQLRLKLAKENHVAPFIIFSDRALAEMAAYLPTHPVAFLNITGVGQKKLEQYGELFLREINDYLDN